MRTIPGCDREALGRLMDEGLVIVEEFPGRLKNHYATLTDSGLDRAEQLAALYK